MMRVDLKSLARQATRSSAKLAYAGLVLAGIMAAAAHVDAASVSLTWNAPTTNADGSALTDLASYRIYLGTSTPACPSGSFLTVGSPTNSPPAGQVVSTRVTALSAGTTYFVRITAVDSGGAESSCSTSANGVAQADFTVTPTSTTNFGSVTVGNSADATFTVQNTSTASITGTVNVGAPYSIVSGGSFTLAAGASQNVVVRFRPTTAGTFAGNVNFVASGDTTTRVLSGAGVAVPTAALSVSTTGTGAGTVSSNPAGISCGATCSAAVPIGTSITLTATAASGSTFMGWSGACNGTGTCSWTMNANAAVTATFDNTGIDRPLQPSPVPVITSLAPTTAVAGSPALTLIVTGSGFASGSVVRWNGSNRTTTVVSTTQLTATITAADLASARTMPVTVFTPTPGGGTSNTINFVVAAAPAAPTLSSLSPTSANAGSSDLTLTVNGSQFVSSSLVRWNGSNRATTFVSASQLRATITAADLVTPSAVPVSVFTPAPGGGTSAVKTFTVTTAPAAPAAPGSLTITPGSGDTTGVPFTITWPAVSGATSYKWLAAFSDGTGVQQGTVTGPSVSFRMPYHVSGAAASGFVCVSSSNSAGQSADQVCSAISIPARPVSMPAPVMSSLSPASAVAGSGAMTLTVNGSNFASSSVVRWGGSNRTTTFVNATQLQAAINAADLTTSRTVSVTVFTPAPGGGTSGAQTFTVTTPPPTAPAPLPGLPGTPGNPSVTLLGTDASGASFNVTWGAATGATSYRYTAGFVDGTASQQGTVAGLLSLQLRMPYHASGAAASGFVCLLAVNAAGQSTDQACSSFSVPAPASSGSQTPVIRTLSPSSATAGEGAFTMTVTGTGFASNSVIRWNNAPRATTYVSATTLRMTVTGGDLQSPGSATISVSTGGAKSGNLTFTINAPVTMPMSFTVLPATPVAPTVRQGIADALGVPFTIAWGNASGATSYRYVAAFSDGSALQQGGVTTSPLDLRMPYHWSGAARSGFICIRAVNAAGQSTDQACSGFNVPAR